MIDVECPLKPMHNRDSIRHIHGYIFTYYMPMDVSHCLFTVS